MRQCSHPGAACVQVHPADDDAQQDAEDSHQQNTEDRMVRIVVPLCDGRGVPNSPDSATDDQSFLLAEWHQAREQESAPTQFLAHGKNNIDKWAKEQGLDNLNQNQCTGGYWQLRTSQIHLLLHKSELCVELTSADENG